MIAVFGPTASGKSAVADLLAERLGTEVVSCDAMQVYSGLPILTNQPRRPTRLVGLVGLDEEMSVGAYARLAHHAVDELVGSRGSAVLCGGTGLYLRAAIAELEIPPAPAAGRREHWEAVVDADRGRAHAMLRTLDPSAAQAVHPNDRRRMVRALELAEAGSSLVPAESVLWGAGTRLPTLVVGLDVRPEELGRRIVARTEVMFAAGVVDEVRSALAGSVSRTAEKALGLREIAELPEAEARERIIVRTRRYAAYQRKWMRRIPGLAIVDASRPTEAVAGEILRIAASDWPPPEGLARSVAAPVPGSER